MRKRILLGVAPLVICLVSLFPALCSAQSGNSADATSIKAASSGWNEFAGTASSSTVFEMDYPQLGFAPGVPSSRSTPAAARSKKGSPVRIGVGLKLSSLGVGIEAAAQVTHRTNIRGGFNFFQYTRSFNKDGINYTGRLRFQSAEAHFDWFPFAHGFHLSPGLLAYNDNHVSATAAAPPGQSFTIGGVSYTSDPTGKNPLTGNANLSFNKVAPTFLIGMGNLVPRGHKHFSMDFEIGAAYQGAPKFDLNLTGVVCNPSLIPPCQPVSSNASVQSNVQNEQSKIRHDISPFKVFPLLSLGFGYRF